MMGRIRSFVNWELCSATEAAWVSRNTLIFYEVVACYCFAPRRSGFRGSIYRSCGRCWLGHPTRRCWANTCGSIHLRPVLSRVQNFGYRYFSLVDDFLLM